MKALEEKQDGAAGEHEFRPWRFLQNLVGTC
jgi:hypothetical protein